MLTTLSEHACFGGVQGFYSHQSDSIGLPMRFAVYAPPQAKTTRVPVLFYLAGLTCTEETFAIKAGAQRVAAELGLMLVCPDTSPRKTGIEGAATDWDFGEGAGFYIDATESPWHQYFQMERYIVDELRQLVIANFAADEKRIGIFGHSMGGHGALTLAFKHPQIFKSVSAFAPISAPSQCAWGEKAFSRYLGSDKSRWAAHDACQLIEQKAAHFANGILVDQGRADKFLTEQQLRPDLLEAACQAAGQPLTLRYHDGYDHGYYFIASLMEAHLRFHYQRLTK
jgi:S-formylglutathione hydrolase